MTLRTLSQWCLAKCSNFLSLNYPGAYEQSLLPLWCVWEESCLVSVSMATGKLIFLCTHPTSSSITLLLPVIVIMLETFKTRFFYLKKTTTETKKKTHPPLAWWCLDTGISADLVGSNCLFPHRYTGWSAVVCPGLTCNTAFPCSTRVPLRDFQVRNMRCQRRY